MTLPLSEDAKASAGEYVLGTLVGDERRQFEARLATDPALQAEVYAWQDQLLTLALRVGPVEPDPKAWTAIERGLVGPGAAERPALTTAVPSAAGSAIRPAARPTEAANDPFWQRLGFWRALSGVSIAASVVLASLLVVRGPVAPNGDPARYLTLLEAPDRSTGWLVEVTAGRQLRLVPVKPGQSLPAGKALQFWTKLDGAAGPTSLGLIRPGEVTEVALDRLPGVAEKQLFELTLEPETGSPIGKPTGPILYVGRSLRL